MSTPADAISLPLPLFCFKPQYVFIVSPLSTNRPLLYPLFPSHLLYFAITSHYSLLIPSISLLFALFLSYPLYLAIIFVFSTIPHFPHSPIILSYAPLALQYSPPLFPIPPIIPYSPHYSLFSTLIHFFLLVLSLSCFIPHYTPIIQLLFLTIFPYSIFIKHFPLISHYFIFTSHPYKPLYPLYSPLFSTYLPLSPLYPPSSSPYLSLSSLYPPLSHPSLPLFSLYPPISLS